MRLWFDEDLSPTLVQVAHELGFEGTCNRDRDVLGVSDAALRQLVQREGFVLVTDNASDFRPMYRREDVHPGLIVVPAGYGRATGWAGSDDEAGRLCGPSGASSPPPTT